MGRRSARVARVWPILINVGPSLISLSLRAAPSRLYISDLEITGLGHGRWATRILTPRAAKLRNMRPSLRYPLIPIRLFAGNLGGSMTAGPSLGFSPGLGFSKTLDCCCLDWRLT